MLNIQIALVSFKKGSKRQQQQHFIPNVSKQDELAELALSEEKKRGSADFSYSATIEISIVIKQVQ